MNKNRIILISIFVATSIVIATALYFFFFKPIVEINQPTQQKTTPTTLPTADDLTEFNAKNKPDTTLPQADTQPSTYTPPEPEKITEPESIAQGSLTTAQTVVTTATRGLTSSANGNGIIYYDEATNRFYEFNNNGDRKALSQKQFFNIESVQWSPNRDKAVIEYPDGFNIIYDFKQDKQTTLPSHWEQFEFSHDNQKISALSLGIHRSQNWLLTVNTDGTNAKAIEPLGDFAHRVISKWSPDSQIIAFSQTGDPAGGDAQEIYLLGQNNENFRSLIVDGYGFQPQWSQNGKQLLYSTHSQFSNYKPLLWVVDANGSDVGANRRELGINTWAEKCTFSAEQSIICAIPQVLPENAGFVPAIADTIPDVFFKIDTVTGLKTPLAVPDVPTTAKELSVSNDGKYLYYKNNISKTTERIRLK